MTQNDIVKAIKNWLEGHDWHFDYSSKSSVFYMGVSIKCEISRLRVVIDVREDYYLVYAIIGIGCSNNLQEMMKFLTLANYGLINGNFELDVKDGEIRYKTYVNCDGLKELSEHVIGDSILCACHTVKKYSSGIANICVSPDKYTADTEIVKCEPWQARQKD